jgi:hypothetical protein
MPAIAVLGTFDTKGPEHGFVADLIRSGSSQPEGLAEGSRGSRRAQRDDTPGLLPIAHRPRRGRRRIPTGFRPLAQGWRTAPTLGEPTQQRNNLEEVAAGAGHNPFRVDRIRNGSPKVARASQPRATRRNPVGILHWPTHSIGCRCCFRPTPKLHFSTTPTPPCHAHHRRSRNLRHQRT